MHRGSIYGLHLCEAEFDVGHWFESLVEGHPLTIYTPSLGSIA